MARMLWLALGLYAVTVSRSNANIAGLSDEDFKFLSINYPDEMGVELAKMQDNPENDAAAPQACNSILLQHCQNSFNNYLNISNNTDWHTPANFNQAIYSRMYNSTSGLLQVCGAWQQFYQCLGSTYSQCINPLNFLTSGFSITASFQYVETMHALSFKCNGGLEQSVPKWNRVISVFNQNFNQIEGCFSAFNQSINQNFSNYCPAVVTLENCFSSFFINVGSEIVWWACEDIRTGFSFTFCPDSGQLVCQVLRKKSEEIELAAADKQENGLDEARRMLQMDSPLRDLYALDPPQPCAEELQEMKTYFKE